MFSRIYMAMFVSVIIAALGSYAIYQFSFSERQKDFQTQNMNGMVALIAQRYQDQAPNDQSRFLDLVAQLTGAEINQVSAAATPAPVLSELQKKSLTHQYLQEGIFWWFKGKGNFVSLSLNGVSERQLRAYALLLSAELERQAEAPNLAQLQLFSVAPLQVAQLQQLQLDPQMMSRLYRNSVVVDYSVEQQITVFTPMSDNRVLIMGPIANFEPLPTNVLLTMLGFTAGFIIVVAYLMVRRMELRIGVIVDFVNNLAKGDLSSRTELKGKDQFAHLASRVNSMAVQIEELMLSQKEMLQAISHDLRTPIARIRFRLDMLSDDAEGPALEQKTNAIKNDIEELESLISQVLTHMKLTQADEVLCQPIVLADDLNALLEEQSLAFPSIDFNFDVETQLQILADPLMFKRMMQNLVTNAAKHAKQQVLVIANQLPQGIELSVHDDGEGIPAEQRNKIFEPFYRIDSSRNRKTGGYGLGLSIIKKIADLHRAKIRVEQSHLGGALFVVFMPKKDAK